MNVLSSDIRLHVERMQTILKEEGIDAFIGASSVATLYFFGQVFSGLVYIPQQGEPIYLIRRPQSFGEHQGLHYIRKIEQLGEIVDLTNISKIALETDELPYSDIERQQKMFHQAEVFNGTALLRKIRMVKTPYEIAEVRKNCLKHIAVYEKVKQIYRVGMSDTELQIEIEHLMRQGGSIGLFRCFGSLMEFHMGSLLSGNNADAASPYDFALGGGGNEALPLGANGSPLKEGQAIMLDMAGNYGVYLSDISRTYSIGKLPEEAYRLHELSRRMHREVMQTAKPGTSCSSIYLACLEMAKQEKAEQYFMGHSSQAQFVGHGLGLQINELPVLTTRSKDVLQEGMIIAFEPKFVIPEVGAVGIENTYLITADGVENLSPMSEDIVDLNS